MASIWTVDVASRVQTQRTDDIAEDDEPAWSPDGSTVAFASYSRGAVAGASIWVLDLAGGDVEEMTIGGTADHNPAWSPDGAQIAFSSQRITDSWSVTAVDVVTRDMTRLTDDSNNVFDATWSPDGTAVAFRSGTAIVVKDLTVPLAEGYTTVVEGTGGDAMPNWSTPTLVASPPTGAATVTVGDTQGRAGGTVSVPIETTDVTGLDLIGVTVTLTYDPSLLTPTDDGVSTTAATLGPVLADAGTWIVEQNVPTPGQLYVALAGDAAAGSGVLLSVAFDIAVGAAAGATSPLMLTQSSLNEGEIATTAVDGTFSVLTLVYGDVTGNGAATSFDAAWVLDYVANAALGPAFIVPFGIEESAPTWSATPVTAEVAFEVADVDADAALTAMDAALILRYDVQLIASFPAETPAAPTRVAGPVAYTIRGASTRLRPGVRTIVSLDAEAVDSLYAGEARIDFDPTTLRLVDVRIGDAAEGAGRRLVAHRVGDGQVAAAFASARPLRGDGSRLEFEFEVAPTLRERSAGEIRASRVRLNGVPTASQIGYAYSVEPYAFRLMANYPNPFNPETWIPFELAEDAHVTLRIYDLAGGLVRSLDVGRRPAGEHVDRTRAAHWDGRNAAGEQVSSGVYAYELRAGEHRELRRMVVRK